MLECNLSHDDIMSALLQPREQSAKDTFVTCLFVSFKYEYSFEHKKIFNNLKKQFKGYDTSLRRSRDGHVIGGQTCGRDDSSSPIDNQSNCNQEPSLANQNYSKSDEEELVYLMHSRPLTLFESVIDQILVNLQSTSLRDNTYKDSILPYCVKYFGQSLQETNLTSLDFGHTPFSSDLYFDLVNHLKGTQIATLKLPIFNWGKLVKELATCSVHDDVDKSRIDVALIDSSCDEKSKSLKLLPTTLKNTEISSLDFNCNTIDLKILSSSLIGSNITFLGLKMCNVQKNGLSCLGSILKDTLIVSIDLSFNRLNCESLKVFAPGLEGTHVKSLNLSDNEIGVDGMNCLGRVLNKTEITSIDASSNILEGGSLKEFVNGLVHSKIASLFLKTCSLSLDNFNYLVSNLKNTQITLLDLSTGNLENVIALSAGLVGSKIETLNLSGSYFDLATVQCLVDALKSTQIRVIDISDCICDEGLKVFVRCLEETKITSLDLKIHRIDLNLQNFLVSVSKNSQITSIGLSNMDLISSDIDDWKKLGNVLKNTKITSINVDDNNFSGNGIAIFAPFFVGSNLTSLHLKGNYTIPDALKPLASVLKYTQITSLDLHNNGFCTPASCNNIRNLVLSLPETNVTSLNLGGKSSCSFLYVAFILKYTRITSFKINTDDNMHLSNLAYIWRKLNDEHIASLVLAPWHRYECSCTFSLCFLAHIINSTRIISLELLKIGIENDALKYISRGLINSNILKLDLSGNNIDCFGVFYLSEVLRYTQITELNLSENSIACEGAQFLAECLADTQIVKLDLSDNRIGREAARKLCESACQKRVNDLMYVQISGNDQVEPCYWSLYRCPGCIIQIDQLMPTETGDSVNLINKAYQKSGITTLILQRNILEGAFDDIDITEVEINPHFFPKFFKDSVSSPSATLLGKSNFVALRIDLGSFSCNEISPFLEFLKRVNLIALHFHIICNWNYVPHTFFSNLGLLGRILVESNIVYLDFSNNKLENDFLRELVKVLMESGCKVISLNLSNNELGAEGMKLLASALPDTKLTYIDLHGNKIGYSGYKYLTENISNTSVCWLSLGNNNIEEGLQQEIELSPYIVPRKSTPVEFQIRYLFRELVSLNTDSKQFEFIVPQDNSVMTIGYYPRLVKHLLDTPIYKMHIYDYFYMQTMRKHDIHVLNRINVFVREMKNNFILFFESKMVQIGERFGNECFLKLVEEFDCLNLTDFVEFLLLHRSLYYVDDNQNILHPFIYSMLHKYQMTLYNENIEPNKKQQIIAYFQEHSDIDGAQEIIDLLK